MNKILFNFFIISASLVGIQGASAMEVEDQWGLTSKFKKLSLEDLDMYVEDPDIENKNPSNGPTLKNSSKFKGKIKSKSSSSPCYLTERTLNKKYTRRVLFNQFGEFPESTRTKSGIQNPEKQQRSDDYVARLLNAAVANEEDRTNANGNAIANFHYNLLREMGALEDPSGIQ